MKTKEQKRREAYDNLVKTAQACYRTWLSMKNNPTANSADREAWLLIAQTNAAQVWQWHRDFGYPLPDTSTFYNH